MRTDCDSSSFEVTFLKSFLRTVPLTLASLLLLAGCGSLLSDNTGRYASPIGGSPVIGNDTPYSEALRCIAKHLDETIPNKADRVAIAVGQISDYTGKYDDYSGSKVTQGAALMAMAALDKAGVRLLERFDIAVSELELKLANNSLISNADGQVRQVYAGSVPGSHYYLVGGITELNYNISSLSGGAFYQPVQVSGRYYVLNTAMDMRLVHTESLEVVDLASYQKQILGREVTAGIFEFFGGQLFDLSLAERSLEPIQLAVRMIVERAVFGMVSDLYEVDSDICALPIPPLRPIYPPDDPLRQAPQPGVDAPRQHP